MMQQQIKRIMTSKRCWVIILVVCFAFFIGYPFLQELDHARYHRRVLRFVAIHAAVEGECKRAMYYLKNDYLDRDNSTRQIRQSEFIDFIVNKDPYYVSEPPIAPYNSNIDFGVCLMLPETLVLCR